jgi:hypothetical protein
MVYITYHKMADDEEERPDDVEEVDGEEEEEEGTFSKVGGMFGGDKANDDDASKKKEDANAKNQTAKAKPKSLFDLEALKEFGLSVLTLFIETVIISVICVNIMFFAAPESIKDNRINLNKLFPTDRHEWPYCYTNEYTKCDADCDDKFGGIADDPKIETAKKIYLKAAILLDTYVFKWFCLTKEDVDMINESVEEGVTKVNLLNWKFIKARFKQWINNSFIFSFSSDRAMLSYIFEQITRISNAIPVELYDAVSPLLIIFIPFVFILLVGFMLVGGPFFTTVIGMIVNQTDNRNEFIGGILWSLLTGFGLGIFPVISYFVQLIQFIGTLIVYPLLHWDQYRELYARYVPIIFFFFNLTLMFYAFEYLDINVAAIVILMLLMLYLTHYWQGIMDFINSIKNWGG